MRLRWAQPSVTTLPLPWSSPVQKALNTDGRDRPVIAGATLPEPAIAMDTVVRGVSELQCRLSQIGVVQDGECAARLQASLVAGQRLTTRDGGLWRWDGFTLSIGAPDSMAVRIRQRNRKTEIEARLADLCEQRGKAEALLGDARTVLAVLVESEQAHRRVQREAQKNSDAAHDRTVVLETRQLETEARLKGLDESRARSLADQAEAVVQRRTAQAELDALSDTEQMHAQVAEGRLRLSGERETLAAALGDHDRLDRETRARRARLSAIEAEQKIWAGRVERASERVSDLGQRRDGERARLKALVEQPAQIEASRVALGVTMREAEITRQASADALARAETALDAADRAVREADGCVASAREWRVKSETARDHLKMEIDDLRARILDRFDCDPERVLERAGIDPETPPVDEDLASVEAQIEQLLRKRERLGAVNLRAEHEAGELEERIAGMESERDDLAGAISRLRRAVSSLNREGGDRLAVAFETMNRHFGEMFSRLFGGGQAHLALIEGEDPLDAGLEIMARPPGKTLQRLTLLSGGEQALTGLALVFAAFLAHPSPICILDEVDAPLDDNNVSRFCDLLEDLSCTIGTRFVIITHHRLTMARVSRLYGVTMAERGVSQLVSVDLGHAVRLRDTG